MFGGAGWAVVSTMVAVLGGLHVMQQVERGDVEAATRALLVLSTSFVAGFVLLTGGFFGPGAVFLVNLPLLAVFVGANPGRATMTVLLVVLATVALAYALPDLEPTPLAESRIRLGRTIAVITAIAFAGGVAMYAVRRLERAVAAAEADEREARSATQRKQSFLANISHELRTPMNAIIGYSELIVEDERCATCVHSCVSGVEQVLTAGRSMLGLVNRVLDHARNDAIRVPVVRRVRVGELIEWLVGAGGGALLRRSGDAAVAGDLAVDVDPELLEALVTDLVDGYLRGGCRQVQVSAMEIDDGVAMRFDPGACGCAPVEPGTIGWALVERNAQSIGLRAGRDGAAVELVLPLASRSREILARFDRQVLGSIELPEHPFDATRIRLSVALVLMSLAIVLVVGPPTVLLSGDSVLFGLSKLAGWLVVLTAVYATYRAGWLRTAGLALSVGSLALLTDGMWADGGPAAISIMIFPVLTVLGILVNGSRAGLPITAFAMGCVALLGGADQLGALPEAAPTSRLEAAFTTFTSTLESALFIGVWAGPLAATVRQSHQAAMQAQAAEASMSRFLDVVSGELRAPLLAIMAQCSRLLGRIQTPQVACDLARVHDASQDLLVVVDDLLDMSAIADDQVEILVESVALEPLIRRVLAVLAPLVDRNDNATSLRLSPDADSVLADPDRLRQVLVNLVSNAAKFTRSGEIAVAVERRGDTVSIAVSDSGIGIAEEDLSELFTPFRQVHRGKPGQYGGTGLGLAISRQLARKMGGDVTVRSVVGEGSTFEIRLTHASAARATA